MGYALVALVTTLFGVLIGGAILPFPHPHILGAAIGLGISGIMTAMEMLVDGELSDYKE